MAPPVAGRVQGEDLPQGVKQGFIALRVPVAWSAALVAKHCMCSAGAGWRIPSAAGGGSCPGEEAASGRGAGHHGIRLFAHHCFGASARVPGRSEPGSGQLSDVRGMLGEHCEQSLQALLCAAPSGPSLVLPDMVWPSLQTHTAAMREVAAQA